MEPCTGRASEMLGAPLPLEEPLANVWKPGALALKWDLLSGVIHTPELPTGSCQFGGELSEIMSTLTLFPFPSQSCLLLCWFLLGNTWDTLICVRLFVTPWTVARQAPLSMQFSRQGYWNRLPSPGDLPNTSRKSNPGLLRLLHWQADSLPLSQEAQVIVLKYFKRSSVKMLLINLCTWYFICLFEGLSRQSIWSIICSYLGIGEAAQA